MTDIVPRPLVDPAAVRDLGALVASSAYFADAKQAAQAAVKIMAGAELGLGPIASMRGIDIIKGEVSLSAGAVAALVRRSGVYDYAIKRWDDSGCSIVFSRNGRSLMPISEFGPEDARKAGLTGENYRKYPRNMYFARAMTNGARLHCPDLFVGSVYTPDELGADAVVWEDTTDAVEAVEAPGDPADAPGAERPAEATQGASTGTPGVVHVHPITPRQEGYLIGLIRQAYTDGMTMETLQATLEQQGIDLTVQAGWLRKLSSDQASRLIAVFEAGTTPVRDPADPGFEL